MKKLYYILLTMMVLTCTSIGSYAQIEVTEEMPVDTVPPVKQAWQDNITINADPRLAILVEKHKNSQLGGVRNMRGYRIQIYYGNDRNIAIQRKIDFMRRHPNVKTYMSYTQPQYRVKVGDFASREDALDLYRETINMYGACMIVPDNVTINYNQVQHDN